MLESRAGGERGEACDRRLGLVGSIGRMVFSIFPGCVPTLRSPVSLHVLGHWYWTIGPLTGCLPESPDMSDFSYFDLPDRTGPALRMSQISGQADNYFPRTNWKTSRGPQDVTP